MTPFEEELRAALKREEAPPGFADRVMARLPKRSPRWAAFFGTMFRLPQVRWAMAGCLLLAMLTGVSVHQQRAQRLRAEGEQARAQVFTALRIASFKLNATRARVQSIGLDPAATYPSAADERPEQRN